MAWSKNQITLAKIAQKVADLNDAHYRLVLRNVAGIRDVAGKVSATNPSASNAGFERFMAYCEQHGFIDRVHGPHHWQQCAARQCDRMWHKIERIVSYSIERNWFHQDGLPGFVEHTTQNRPLEDGGATRNLYELDARWTYCVLEGLKSMISAKAFKQGVKINWNEV